MPKQKEVVKTETKPKKTAKVLAIVQAFIIWTALVVGLGFYLGQSYANDKHESVKSEAKSIVTSLE